MTIILSNIPIIVKILTLPILALNQILYTNLVARILIIFFIILSRSNNSKPKDFTFEIIRRVCEILNFKTVMIGLIQSGYKFYGQG